MPLNAVLFDMDGLLINSEPFWQQAEIDVLGALGLHLTPAESSETIGMRLDQVVAYHYARHPWQGPSQENVLNDILDRVVELVRTQGQAQPGVYETLDFFADSDLRVALATSSHVKLIDAVLERLDITEYFEEVASAQFEEYGKPHPAVFLTAARKLDVDPQRCLVFEDSLRGVIAAKAAQMACVCVPDPSLADNPQLVLADEVLASLQDFDEAVWSRLNR